MLESQAHCPVESSQAEEPERVPLRLQLQSAKTSKFQLFIKLFKFLINLPVQVLEPDVVYHPLKQESQSIPVYPLLESQLHWLVVESQAQSKPSVPLRLQVHSDS